MIVGNVKTFSNCIPDLEHLKKRKLSLEVWLVRSNKRNIRVCVTGRTKSGKSTFFCRIIALLTKYSSKTGLYYLSPQDTDRCTNCIIRVIYGRTETIEFYSHEGKNLVPILKPVSLAKGSLKVRQLKLILRKIEERSGEYKDLHEILIRVNQHSLRGFEFVDTPGLGETSRLGILSKNEYTKADVIVYCTKSDENRGYCNDDNSYIQDVMDSGIDFSKLIILPNFLDRSFKESKKDQKKEEEEEEEENEGEEDDDEVEKKKNDDPEQSTKEECEEEFERIVKNVSVHLEKLVGESGSKIILPFRSLFKKWHKRADIYERQEKTLLNYLLKMKENQLFEGPVHNSIKTLNNEIIQCYSDLVDIKKGLMDKDLPFEKLEKKRQEYIKELKETLSKELDKESVLKYSLKDPITENDVCGSYNRLVILEGGELIGDESTRTSKRKLFQNEEEEEEEDGEEEGEDAESRFIRNSLHATSFQKEEENDKKKKKKQKQKQKNRKKRIKIKKEDMPRRTIGQRARLFVENKANDIAVEVSRKFFHDLAKFFEEYLEDFSFRKMKHQFRDYNHMSIDGMAYAASLAMIGGAGAVSVSLLFGGVLAGGIGGTAALGAIGIVAAAALVSAGSIGVGLVGGSTLLILGGPVAVGVIGALFAVPLVGVALFGAGGALGLGVGAVAISGGALSFFSGMLAYEFSEWYWKKERDLDNPEELKKFLVEINDEKWKKKTGERIWKKKLKKKTSGVVKKSLKLFANSSKAAIEDLKKYHKKRVEELIQATVSLGEEEEGVYNYITSLLNSEMDLLTLEFEYLVGDVTEQQLVESEKEIAEAEGTFGEVRKISDELAVKKVVLRKRGSVGSFQEFQHEHLKVRMMKEVHIMNLFREKLQGRVGVSGYPIPLKWCLFRENLVSGEITARIGMKCFETNLGDLLLDKSVKIRWREKLGIMLDVIIAVGEFHQNKLVHRDIKPFNILTEESKFITLYGKPMRIIAICDFGCSTEASSGHLSNDVGTNLYLDKSVQFGVAEYGTPMDIYALGLTLAQVWGRNGRVLSPEFERIVSWPEVQRYKEEIGDFILFESNIDVHPNLSFSSELIKLLQRCCSLDEKDRPNCEELITAFRKFHNSKEEIEEIEDDDDDDSEEEKKKEDQLKIFLTENGLEEYYQRMVDGGVEYENLPFFLEDEGAVEDYIKKNFPKRRFLSAIRKKFNK